MNNLMSTVPIRKQRLYGIQCPFVVGNSYKWEMVDNKDIKLQINEYHKLLEELKAEKIELPVCCRTVDRETT